MLKRFLLGTAGLVTLTGLAVTAANAVLIDNFNNSPQRISIAGPEAHPGGSDPSVMLLDNDGGGAAGADTSSQAGIIGGYRDITTTLVESPDDESFTRANANISGNGLFRHNQDGGVRSHTFITWDGLAGAGLGGADLTGGGLANAVHIIVNFADLGLDWSLEFFDGVDTSIFTFPSVAIASDTSLYIPFTSWSPLIDFTSIQRITFGANIFDVAALDTIVNHIETACMPDQECVPQLVPEPASMALFGAGLMGLGGFTRRRKTA